MLEKSSILIAALALWGTACSDNNVDKDVPGAIPLDLGKGEDSFWIDTDGVDPEVAGCHIEFSEDTCEFVAVQARNFGEFCQDDGTLVESNPAAGECHTHDDDIGYPFVVDCAAWCTDTLELPNGQRRGVASSTGTCQVVNDVPCDEGVVESARCVCT